MILSKDNFFQRKNDIPCEEVRGLRKTIFEATNKGITQVISVTRFVQISLIWLIFKVFGKFLRCYLLLGTFEISVGSNHVISNLYCTIIYF